MQRPRRLSQRGKTVEQHPPSRVAWGMAEIQRTNQTQELTNTFMQFLMMQTQQALLALGKHPKRPENAPPPNLQLGKLFVDHLIMLRWKMEGNLTADEKTALDNAVTHLQNAFVEATQEAGK
jgi:ABC-type Fe3+ transport system substrate-binding protein